MVDLPAIRERLRQSLWFVPGLFALGAFVFGGIVLTFDRELSRDPGDLFFLFGGTAEGARNVLSTIAQSMLTFTGLVFTITMLVLQLASTQLSPRVMRTFLRDRGNQVVLGLFVATFVYTLLVLRDVRAAVDDGEGFIPGLSIWLAFVLLLASVAAFIYYIDHMAHAIRASTVLENIARETRGAIDRLYPDPVGHEPEEDEPTFRDSLGEPTRIVGASRSGVLLAVDQEPLLDAVGKSDRRLELGPRVGDYVPEGAPLFHAWGDWDDEAVDRARSAMQFGGERSLDQDAAFGFRQLVDVAVRALSPGTNDPTTAVQALDHIHDLLRRLASRDIPSPLRADDAGTPRLLLNRPDWDDYVGLALEEIRLAGEGQIQVVRRLEALLDDLLRAAPDGRQEVIRIEQRRLAAAIERAFQGDDATAPATRARARSDDAR